ncbi:MAG: efflux RND transporter periplasmic adaptor subunit [Cyanobacteriota bacterium]|nr:efflux RND transporter periplasmic adaptor subunit [Cyanobacteriota bacterium]
MLHPSAPRQPADPPSPPLDNLGKGSPVHLFWSSGSRFWGLGLLISGGILLGVWRQPLGLVQAADPKNIEAADREAVGMAVATLSIEPVTTHAVERVYTGEVIARRTSDLGFERGGERVSVLVEEGDVVEAGSPLARLDTRKLQAEKAQVMAQQARAQAQLAELQAGPRQEVIAAAAAAVQDLAQQRDLAETKRLRRQELYAAGAISREQLDELAFETRALEARWQAASQELTELKAGTRPEQIAAQSAAVQQLAASLSRVEVDISQSTLTAPFAGRITQRFVDEGTVLGSGQPVLRLVEVGSLEARIGVPSQATTALSIGSTQTVWVGETAYPAQVSALLPEVNPTTRTLPVILRLPDSLGIPSGQTARLSLTETVEMAGFWLPTTALVPGTRGLWSAYTVEAGTAGSQGDFQIKRQDLEILHTEGEKVLVRGTLQAGDQVVATGVQRLVPGQSVIPQPTTWLSLP